MMNVLRLLAWGGFILSVQSWAIQVAHAADPPRPNIVWFIVDDMSANFSVYGESVIQTPNVDELAREGTMFRHAFVTAPVCSPCRSALITGMYQTSIGAHHHRSGRGTEKIQLPRGVEPVPAIFKRAGYYTAIGGFNASGQTFGKTDYNFEWDPAIYDGNDWSGRKPGQPFFMQVQVPGGKLRERSNWTSIAQSVLGTLTSPAAVKLPLYYPPDPVLLEDWARYLDAVRYTDWQVGEVMKKLKEQRLLDQTVVIFMTDHGISHARGKQFLYDEGIHVPLVMRGPGIERGAVRMDFAQQIDLVPTSLALAGIEIPQAIQGRNLFDFSKPPREAIFAARDRCDETVENLRAVRTGQFKYIRNGYPQRPHLQPNRYKDNKAIVKRLRELHEQKKLNPLQEKLLFAEVRPKEELYDLRADPNELNNLVDSGQYVSTLQEMRQTLDKWIVDTNDLGQKPESKEMYGSDMKVYLLETNDSGRTVLEKNIELMNAWAGLGK